MTSATAHARCAPLRAAPDAVEIDTSSLTVGEVVARIAELVRGVAGR